MQSHLATATSSHLPASGLSADQNMARGNSRKHVTAARNDTPVFAQEALVLCTANNEARLDSRLLAEALGLKHRSVFKLIGDYRIELADLGKLRFEIAPSPGSATSQTSKFALLTEDQCYLILTYSRNTPLVRRFKLQLVKAFREARAAADLHQMSYLPGYHRLHASIHALAAGSPNERFVHQNVNKAINKAAGVPTGERACATLPQRALLIVAQDIAANAIGDAKDHREGFLRIKAALQPLAALTLSPTTNAGRLHHG